MLRGLTSRCGWLAAIGVVGALCVAGVGWAGCSAPARQATFDSDDPAERSLAIGRVAREGGGDPQRLRDVIEQLESQDPATRLFAIRTLEKFSGDALGYEHEAPRVERDEAVQRWLTWYVERENANKPVNPIIAPAGTPKPLPAEGR